MIDEAVDGSDADTNATDSATPGVSALDIGDERLAYRGLGLRMLIRPEIVGLLGAAAIYIFFWGVTRPFGTAGGAATVLDVAATLGIMAVAVAVLMIGGEFDLSSGANTGAMAIAVILLVKDTGERGGLGLSYWLAIPLSFAVAMFIGWLNGTMVERTKLPSFIVTLATFFVLRGVKLAFSKIVVDQIQVGTADEGAHYDFWQRIFGSTWTRVDHIWEGRDAVYTGLVLIGATLIIASVYEFAFRRRSGLQPTGLVIGVVGLALGIFGVLRMHWTDNADWLQGAMIGIGALLAIYGLCTWRYEPVAAPGPLEIDGTILRPAVIGGLLVGAAVAVAAWMDAYDEENVVFLVTHQGARAIIFALLAGIGGVFFWSSAYRARQRSAATKAFALLVIALVVTALAFFIQSESQSHKFRAEVFAMLLVAALLIAVWAVMSLRFEIRRFVDPSSDRMARLTAVVGWSLLVAGLVVRLLFAVQAEIDRKDPSRLASFSVRIVWFFAFTLVMAWILRKTKFGSWVYAVGGNRDAARQVGVPAARVKTSLFMLVSGAAWLVGILLAFRLNTIQAGTGNGEEFEYIIAAVVGGTMLTGGFGSAIGAAIGAFIMAMAFQGISFAGWNTDWRFVFLGVILLVAVYANQYVRKIAEAAR